METNIFLLVFHGSKIYLRGYFVGLKLFIVKIWWVACEYISEK